MEEQPNSKITQADTRQDLITIIKNTYSASNQTQQRNAEQTVMTLLKTPAFLQKLYILLTGQTQAYQKRELDKAAGVLIKKYSYEYAKTNQDKSQFIQMLYDLLLCDRVGFAAKQMLGVALEHQFNVDEGNLYRKTVVENVLRMFQQHDSLANFQGLMLVCIAYLNSLVEVEEQIQFLLYSMGSISVGALRLFKEVEQMGLEEWVAREKTVLPKIVKLFEYIEIAVERIIDEQPYLEAELKLIRQNSHLISILQSYLLLFHHNGSMVSATYPPINQPKRMMINVISLLYSNSLCPSKIFHTIYITFLMECQHLSRDTTAEAILISCLEILSMHLEKKYYYKLYGDNLEQTILALFMYSATSKQEYEALDNNPEEFSDIAEYYIRGDEKYYSLKVKTSIFMQIVVQRLDEAMRKMLEIIVLIMAGALQPSANDSAIMTEVKSETSQFNFYGLNKHQQLETSLMMLCGLSHYVHRRNDIGQILYAFFVTQFQVLTRPSPPIVVLRLMRAISCYPTALYFVFIQHQIKKGRVFAIQGLRCFERILKTNRFDQLFLYLANIITHILDFVPVTDPIMQLIVHNNFEKMVRASADLFKAILKKIRDQFYVNKNSNEHETLVCFNLLHGLLNKANPQNYRFELLQIFYQITQHLQLAQNSSLFRKYDEKLVQIFELIFNIIDYIPEQADRFVQHSLLHIQVIDKGSQYFRFYSMYIFKLSGSTYKLQPLFSTFLGQVKKRFQYFINTSIYNDGISYFCFLMSEIIANYCKIDISQPDLKFLLTMAEKLPVQHKQFPLIVFLTHLYQLPYPVCTFLKHNSFYNGFLSQIVKVQFDIGLIKRIFILSLIKLLQIQDNTDNFKNILVYCIDHLKKQNTISKAKPQKAIDFSVRHRRFGQQNQIQKQQHMQYQSKYQSNDNQLINLFIKFKHPFDSMSEFDQFKVVFWQNDQHVNQLSPQIKADLKAILETEWVENKTRRIVHVKR